MNDVIPLSPPARVMPKDLPISAKRTFMKATIMRWHVSAWLTIAQYPETLYSASSEKRGHNAGDVKSTSYEANVFTVEARDPLLPIGFRADYERKDYGNTRKISGGSFIGAQIVDIVGVSQLLIGVYKAPLISRGKYETQASYALKVSSANERVISQNKRYNDGSSIWLNHKFYPTAREFDNWLSEWSEMNSEMEVSK